MSRVRWRKGLDSEQDLCQGGCGTPVYVERGVGVPCRFWGRPILGRGKGLDKAREEDPEGVLGTARGDALSSPCFLLARVIAAVRPAPSPPRTADVRGEQGERVEGLGHATSRLTLEAAHFASSTTSRVCRTRVRTCAHPSFFVSFHLLTHSKQREGTRPFHATCPAPPPPPPLLPSLPIYTTLRPFFCAQAWVCSWVCLHMSCLLLSFSFVHLTSFYPRHESFPIGGFIFLYSLDLPSSAA